MKYKKPNNLKFKPHTGISEFLSGLIILILLLFTNLYPQDQAVNFAHLTSEDGLSINRVSTILQDDRGFIWIGTSNGLNMYDGYSFKTFLPNPLDSGSISSYTINAICEDGNGNIWIGTQDGLNKYDWKTEKFSRYKHISGDLNSLSNNQVLSLLCDNNGNLWIGTLNGLDLYDRGKNNFKEIQKVSDRLNPDSLNSVTGIEQDDNGNLWLGTWNGITCINGRGGIIRQFFSQPAGTKNFNYRFSTVIYKDRGGNIWVGTNGQGLLKYNLKTGDFVAYKNVNGSNNSLSNNYVSAIFQDNSNNLWIGTLHGLNKFNPKQNNFTRILNDPKISSSIISNQITSITQDRTGLIWVGTTGGISKFYLPADKFYYYQRVAEVPGKGLTSSSIISVCIDRSGNIWAGTLNGLNEIKKDGRIIQYKKELGNSSSVSSNFIRSVFRDSNGIVWIGTNFNGLNEYNPSTGRYKLFTYDMDDNNSISNNGITCIFETRSGALWFGTWWGLNRFDRKTGKFTRFLSKPGVSNGLQNDLIWDIFEDSRGMIWVGTDGGGVSEINPATYNFINFSSDSTNKFRISNNRVFTIFESHDGMMWFGTMYGLNRYDRKTGKIKIFTKTDGLPGNLINAVEEDNKNRLWIATDKGLSKYNEKSGTFINYNRRNGLQSLEFVQNVAAKSKDGKIYFGNSGIMYFNPDSIKDEYLQSPVVFTDLKIYNKSVRVSPTGILKNSITGSKSISIPPGQDMITLEFALLDYYNVKRNTFRYKLKGFDIGWNNVGTRNSATYTNLPPGNYTFYVKATNNNGVRNEQEAAIKIIIIPAFYQTIWFRIALAVTILLIMIGIFRVRTKAIIRYNKVLENRVKERTRDLDKTIKELNLEIASKDKFFSIIAHDLRSPFISLLGFSNYLFDELETLAKDELRSISENILKSAKLTFGLLENLLQWARIKTGRIIFEPESVNLNKIIVEISGLFKGNTDNKNITLKVNVPDNILVYADLNMLQTVLRNLVSNSIKFTRNNGNIEISAVEEEESIRIAVKDDGIGMSRDKVDKLFQIDKNVSSSGTNKEEGSGLGLILCKEFIEINNGRIFVKSSHGEGSEFSFILPKAKELVAK